jgi:hypothetical protein
LLEAELKHSFDKNRLNKKKTKLVPGETDFGGREIAASLESVKPLENILRSTDA